MDVIHREVLRAHSQSVGHTKPGLRADKLRDRELRREFRRYGIHIVPGPKVRLVVTR